MTASLSLLHITDLHLLPDPGARLLGVDTTDSLRAVLRQAFAERTPAAVIVSGDVTHHGDAATYERCLRLLRAHHDGPVLLLPGNHDESGAMGAFLDQPAELDLPGWRVIGVDSHADGRPEAMLTDAEREGLAEACERARRAGKAVMLAVHHPPIAVGCPWLDKDRIQNGDELLEWLSEHTTVTAMVFGHAHQVVESRVRGIRLMGTPATCFQFQPQSASFAIDERKPGYRWVELTDDGQVTSEVSRVADYPLDIVLPQRG